MILTIALLLTACAICWFIYCIIFIIRYYFYRDRYTFPINGKIVDYWKVFKYDLPWMSIGTVITAVLAGAFWCLYFFI